MSQGYHTGQNDQKGQAKKREGQIHRPLRQAEVNSVILESFTIGPNVQLFGGGPSGRHYNLMLHNETPPKTTTDLV